jgi:hypothetical protein
MNMSILGINMNMRSKPVWGKDTIVLAGLSALAMLAFTANSLLTRIAFQTTTIDPASFSSIRILSGALMLMIILRFQGGKTKPSLFGWASAFSLFVYMTTFSFAYRGIDTGAGALILFTSAQSLMVLFGLYKGEKTHIWGLLLVLVGMVGFLAPASEAPPLNSAMLMMVAGIAWSAFSLIGKSEE